MLLQCFVTLPHALVAERKEPTRSPFLLSAGPEEHLSDGAVVEVSSGAVNSAGPPSAVPSPGAAALPDTALPPPCKNEGTAGEQATAGSTLPSAHAKVQLLGRGSASDVKPDREGCAPPPLFMQRDDWLPTPTQRQQDGKLQWQRAPSIEESPLGQTLEVSTGTTIWGPQAAPLHSRMIALAA